MSTPLQGRPGSGSAGSEVLTAAAAASASGRLVSVTCLANGKLLTIEPSTDWVQCGGDASASAAELLDSIFVQVPRSHAHAPSGTR